MEFFLVLQITCQLLISQRLKNEDSTQIFRCNPCYRNQPWFDFLYVDYMNASNVVSSCASLLLLWLTFTDPQSNEKCVYAFSHSLANQNTPKWTMLILGKERCRPPVLVFSFHFLKPDITSSSSISSDILVGSSVLGISSSSNG